MTKGRKIPIISSKHPSINFHFNWSLDVIAIILKHKHLTYNYLIGGECTSVYCVSMSNYTYNIHPSKKLWAHAMFYQGTFIHL